ncbi:MAG: hypothetical protein NTW14_11110 [bacterium]|nr:hypothetical protein [bacterium]
MKSILRIMLLLVLVSLLLLTGCESDQTTQTTTPTTSAGWIAQGWAEYHAGQYSDGEQSFQQGINKGNEELVQAYNAGDQQAFAIALENLKQALNGLGWCAVKLNDLTNGAVTFSAAISIDSTYTDALGGYAVLLKIDGNLVQSNTLVGLALAQDSSWEFSQDGQINYLDLRLIRAENYFGLAEFESARTEVIQISGMVGYTAGQGAASLNLATIEGRAALIEMIEELDLNWI